MTRRRTAPLGWGKMGLLVGLALLAGVAEVALAARHGSSPTPRYISDVVFAAGWTVGGLLAWRIRPASRVGRLMLSVGVALFLNNPWGFGLPTDFPLRGLITVFGVVGFWLTVAMVGHLLLSYPSGRLDRRADRIAIGVGYASAIVFPIALLLTLTPNRALCGERCHRSPIQIIENPALYLATYRLTALWFAGLAVCVLVLLLTRFRTATPHQRREHRFTVVTALSAAVLILGYFLVTARAPGSGPSWLTYTASYLCLAGIPATFLVGLLRERFAYAAIGDLVRDMAGMPLPDLERSLARALRDPGLAIVFPAKEAGTFLDRDGRLVAVPDGGPQVVTSIGDESRPVAALVHDAGLTEHEGVLEAVGEAARLALENARLQAEVQAQLAEVRASRSRIVAAGDRERRRLERNLHDGAQQRLLGIGLTLQALRERVPDRDGQLLDAAEGELRSVIRELRDLAQGIHPAVLTDEGLLAAIGLLTRRLSLAVSVEGQVPRRPSPTVEATAYYVASEALQNVVKHASASHVLIRVSEDDGFLEIAISDDGVGGATSEAGSGLRGLGDRVAAAEGRFEVVSPAGEGTTLLARLPCG